VKRTTILIILFTIIIALGCKKENTTPQPPVITFLEARISTSSSASVVKFEFFDENGDLGLRQEENSGEQAFNLFVDYYEKENGIWILKSPIITFNFTENKFDTTELHLRFPFIENEDGSSLTGEAQIDLLYDFTADTFRYEIYIKDRSFKKSNTIVSTEIIVPN